MCSYVAMCLNKYLSSYVFEKLKLQGYKKSPFSFNLLCKIVAFLRSPINFAHLLFNKTILIA